MVYSNPIVNTVNIYIVEPHKLTIFRTPTNVLKKQRKIRGRTRLATINQTQSDTTASDRFLSMALHSVSQAITTGSESFSDIYILTQIVLAFHMLSYIKFSQCMYKHELAARVCTSADFQMEI